MKWSIKLFKIKGIDVKVHLTFVLILIWAAYRWSSSSSAGLEGALFGVAATLLLFVAVTLHELGHSFQALKFGVRVKGITLLPMGGLSQMEKIPEKPSQELRIAIAGPLVNFVIAALLTGLAALLQVPSPISWSALSGSLGQISWFGLLSYLATANLILGLFNLIPAFPMDGGRILRALLAMRMDFTKATRTAAKIGQSVALLLVVWGLMNSNYFLVLIAVTVWMGAGQESREAGVKGTLHEIKVRQAMTLAPQSLKANETLAKAADLTLSTAQSDFPILEWGSNKVVGMMGESDLLRGLQKLGGSAAVREVMHAPVMSLNSDEPIYLALEKMAKGRVRAAPVVDPEGQLVGLLTTEDINEAYRIFSIGQNAVPVTR